jgi:GTPase
VDQVETTIGVLKDLNAEDTPVIYVLNKIDSIKTPEENERLQRLRLAHPHSCLISALEKTGIEALEEEIIKQLEDRRKRVQLRIPQSDYHVLAHAIREGKLFHQEYEDNEVLVDIELPANLLYHFNKYKV